MITISLNGRDYPFPNPPYTFRESNLVKRIAGYAITQIKAETALGDSDLLVAYAILARRRAGDTFADDEMLDLPMDRIGFRVEDDAVPPAATPASAPGSSEAAGAAGNAPSPTTPATTGSPQ